MADQTGKLHSYSLGDYKQTVLKLSIILRKLRDFTDKLNLKQSVQLIDNILQRFETNSFSIAVVGEFKRGKSTFINALLGREILPSDILPTTATLNRVTYGLKPGVKIQYKDGREEEIGIEQLANYVTKLTSESEARAAKIKEAIVYYPIHYCQNNVDIIDTPGLSDDENLTEITLSVLPQVDVAIFVIMTQSPFSQSEQNFLENHLLNLDLGRIIFIVTGIDLCNSPEDSNRLVRSVKDRLQNQVLQRAEKEFGNDSEEYKAYLRKIGQPKVFGVSAYQALQAKKNNNADLLTQSCFPEFQTALEQFLSEERGVVFLQVPVNRAIASATEILAAIGEKENELERKKKKLRLNYENTVNNISNKQQEKQQTEAFIENFRQKIRTFLNSIYPKLKQVVSQVIDTTPLTPSDFNQSAMLPSMLQFDRQVVQELIGYNRKLARELQMELQQGLADLVKTLQCDSDTINQLLNNIERKLVNLAEILSKSIIDSTVAWRVACNLKRGSSGLNLALFKQNYQGEIFKEIAKEFNLRPIHQEIYDLINATLQTIRHKAEQQGESALNDSHNVLAELRGQLEREETLIQLKCQELNEMRLQTQQFLSEAQALSEQLMGVLG